MIGLMGNESDPYSMSGYAGALIDGYPADLSLKDGRSATPKRQTAENPTKRPPSADLSLKDGRSATRNEYAEVLEPRRHRWYGRLPGHR